MLEMPADWYSSSVPHVLRELLRQADALGGYAEAARAVTRGSLEYMLAGPRWAGPPLLAHPAGWRINDWLFHVLPRVDDEALEALVALPRSGCHVDVIAPPWAAGVARHAVRAVLPDYAADVSSIDTYVGQRMLWTSVDANEPHAAALVDLIARYTRLVDRSDLRVRPIRRM